MSQTQSEPTFVKPIRKWVPESATPYVAAVVVTYLVARYANYLADRLGPDQFLIRAQAPGIYVPFVGTVAVLVFWIAYKGAMTRSRLLVGFLILLALAWLIQFALMRYHGDLMAHTVWLFIPTLLLLLFKTPSSRSVRQGLLIFAWTTAIILITTRVLEILGLIPIFQIPDGVVEWENERYWQPLQGLLLLDGRWPGPFGYNAKTGFMSALVLVIGLGIRRRSSWLLVIIGAAGVLATAGRMPYLTVASGLFILFFFGNSPVIRRIPFALRLGTVGVAVVGVGLYFLNSGTGATGRLGESGIWSGYIELWQRSPFIGVGQVGIWEAPERINYSLDAHSIYIQSLAVFGLLGFVAVFGALGLGLVITLRAAKDGWALPLALVTMYLVGGATEVLHPAWTAHSAYTLIVILAVIGAGQRVKGQVESFDSTGAVTPAVKSNAAIVDWR